MWRRINWRIVWRIVKRVILEFLPPTAVACGWVWFNWDSAKPTADYSTMFASVFVMVGMGWWNFLRIQYQQTSRQAQESAQGQLDGISNNVTRVEGLLQGLTGMVEAVRAQLTPQQAQEIEAAVDQANTAIQTASTAIREVQQIIVDPPKVFFSYTSRPSANS